MIADHQASDSILRMKGIRQGRDDELKSFDFQISDEICSITGNPANRSLAFNSL